MFHIWDFDQSWLCKLRMYINGVTTLVSAQLLTGLAVIRSAGLLELLLGHNHSTEMMFKIIFNLFCYIGNCNMHYHNEITVKSNQGFVSLSKSYSYTGLLVVLK